MQSSLEVRSPFLVPSVIEFANRLPDKIKLEGSIMKRLLKQVMIDCGFPSPILNQKKQGFTFPISSWMKGDLKKWINLLEKEEALDGLVDKGSVKVLVNEHINRKRNNSRLLLNLITFAAWRKNFPQLKL